VVFRNNAVTNHRAIGLARIDARQRARRAWNGLWVENNQWMTGTGLAVQSSSTTATRRVPSRVAATRLSRERMSAADQKATSQKYSCDEAPYDAASRT